MRDFDTTNWRQEKILTIEQVATTAVRLKREGKKLVTVNGSFDILHPGHLDQLEEAKKQGDVLFVGINSDAAIEQAKGQSRPFVPEQGRAALLAALACVDYVVIMTGTYQEEPMKTLLANVRPNVHVNGPDYGPAATWAEWPAMQQIGASGYTMTKRNDWSTSSLVQAIRQSTD